MRADFSNNKNGSNNRPLLENKVQHPPEAIVDFSHQTRTPAYPLPAYWKPKKNRWWKTVILLVFLFSLLSAIGVLLWKMAIV
jgi:hypothetical protein